jgi:hypothetical protein
LQLSRRSAHAVPDTGVPYLCAIVSLGQCRNGGQGVLQRARAFLCDALRAGVLIFV